MAIVTISLQDRLKARENEARLEALLLEGLASGEAAKLRLSSGAI
ncbi:hypothetical protein [Rhizobium sullae]|uniref:Uncharacterized protein n=1 Tax=Rhizobium sullae TaxID=50338 RepID=A0A4R3QCD0_RHISU|nr:hypothetical protein [Rhizobium sullae]TCU17172.1 hypothetical protein EV132_104195 [Rhizobium sullae]